MEESTEHPSDSRLLFSVADVCARTGLGRTLVYDEIRSERLRSFKIRGRRVILPTALTEWIEHQEAECA